MSVTPFFTILLFSVFQLSPAPSFSQKGVLESNTIANAFKQGKFYNNCASIALIKATIGMYGEKNVFRAVDRTDSSFIVFRLRNGEDVVVSVAELNFCTLHNGFVTNSKDDVSDRIRTLADTCFAVMCKKEQQSAGSTFEVAVATLNNGYKTSAIAPLLGVAFKKIYPVSVKNLSTYQHIIICNFYHAAYATDGVYDEALNKSGLEKIKNFKWKHLPNGSVYDSYLYTIKEAYQIVDH